MPHDRDPYILAKFKNYGPSIFDGLDVGLDKHLRQVKEEAEAMPAQIYKDLVAEGAQTKYRESETQFLERDLAENSYVHPDKFYRGFGLHYPVLYDPAWPLHIAHRRTQPKPGPPSCRDQLGAEVGSWAVTGMARREVERRPVKQTLCFTHRTMDVPFRQPPYVNMQKPTFEPCEILTIQEINEIEGKIILKSILENLKSYDKRNPKARMKAFQSLLNIQSRPQDEVPPTIKRRGKSKWRQIIDAKQKDEWDDEDSKMVLQTIFVDDGAKCLVHGYSKNLNLAQKPISSVHNIKQVKDKDVVNKKDDKLVILEKIANDDWCHMCNGSNLHRKVYGEDHNNYLRAPLIDIKPIKIEKIDKIEEIDVIRGPCLWCSICKGFDLHKKVYKWPPQKEETENNYNSDDDNEWCPMCKGFKMHRKLYSEDYNDYSNPPYKFKKDNNDKGVYCVYCKGFNIHRIVYDWPILG